MELLAKISSVDLLSCCDMTKKYAEDQDFFNTHCFATSIKVAFAVNPSYGAKFNDEYVNFNKVADSDVDDFIEKILNSDNTLFTLYAFSNRPRLLAGDDGHSMSVIVQNHEFYILESYYRRSKPRMRKVDAGEIGEEIFDLLFQGKIKWLSCPLC